LVCPYWLMNKISRTGERHNEANKCR